GISAQLPLGTDVGPGPQNHIQPLLLRLAHKLGDIVVPGKIVHPLRRLMKVPENIGSNRVQPHSLRHTQALPPVGTGDSGIVHLSGNDLERLAIQLKLSILYLQCTVDRVLRNGKRRNDGQNANDDKRKRSGKYSCLRCVAGSVTSSESEEQHGSEQMGSRQVRQVGWERSQMNIALIARKARVSTATVSRTLNNSPLVREKTATRIRKVIEELGYIPNGSARSLSSGRSQLLGVIISDITNPFFPDLISSFERLSADHSYEVIFANTNYDPARLEHALHRMMQRRVDGIALMTSEMHEPALAMLKKQKIPTVTLQHRI